ncbi:MAG: T9SS type A sorting domain-containing protein [Bacteroidales bacterium]|nr:T9SS type A sorting domain-containing protein [Bacteroidales bacterium]
MSKLRFTIRRGNLSFSRSFDAIQESQVNIKGIEPGIYMVRVTYCDGSFVSKMIIN